MLPILEQVLGPPEEQLDAETREQVVQLVKFLYGKQPQLVKKYSGLMAVVNA